MCVTVRMGRTGVTVVRWRGKIEKTKRHRCLLTAAILTGDASDSAGGDCLEGGLCSLLFKKCYYKRCHAWPLWRKTVTRSRDVKLHLDDILCRAPFHTKRAPDRLISRLTSRSARPSWRLRRARRVSCARPLPCPPTLQRSRYSLHL